MENTIITYKTFVSFPAYKLSPSIKLLILSLSGFIHFLFYNFSHVSITPIIDKISEAR